MKIYVITLGDYSSYHICAVTEDKEKAEHLKRLFSGKCYDAEIEEYNTDEFDFIEKDEVLYCVEKSIGGAINIDKVSADFKMEALAKRKFNVRDYGFEGLEINVLAKDEEHAIKIAQDRFAEYEAEQKGVL